MKEELERNEWKSRTIPIPIIMLSNRFIHLMRDDSFGKINLLTFESNWIKLAPIHDLPLAILIEIRIFDIMFDRFEYNFSKIYAERDI